jgi:hypothetical protein
MLVVTALGVSTQPAPVLIRPPLQFRFHCTLNVSKSILWVWKGENISHAMRKMLKEKYARV